VPLLQPMGALMERLEALALAIAHEKRRPHPAAGICHLESGLIRSYFTGSVDQVTKLYSLVPFVSGRLPGLNGEIWQQVQR